MFNISNKPFLNCNVQFPKPIKITKFSGRQQFKLSKEDTKLFNIPIDNGIIQLKHYSIIYTSRIVNDHRIINISINPFPTYDTIWIQFCKSIHHILTFQKSETIPVKNLITKIFKPEPSFATHYTIKKCSVRKQYVSSNTNKPFRNYPRTYVDVIGHYKRNKQGELIFIKSFKSRRIKINTANPTRMVS